MQQKEDLYTYILLYSICEIFNFSVQGKGQHYLLTSDTDIRSHPRQDVYIGRSFSGIEEFDKISSLDKSIFI